MIKSLSGKSVKFGATVTMIDEETNIEQTWQIVGEIEANLKEGRIASTSPIGRSLIGKSEGDVIEVSSPGGVKSYEIIKVLFQ
jgi:transcription elongation factor GreA